MSPGKASEELGWVGSCLDLSVGWLSQIYLVISIPVDWVICQVGMCGVTVKNIFVSMEKEEHCSLWPGSRVQGAIL